MMSSRYLPAALAIALVAFMHPVAGAFLPAHGQKAAQATHAPKAPHVTARHAGWRKTSCGDCHDQASMAKHHPNPSLRPPDCARCHGFNGAPHEGHAAVKVNPCKNCHATTAHLASFQLPDDCVKCHVHPSSPQGR